jgi:hypothetical protein
MQRSTTRPAKPGKSSTRAPQPATARRDPQVGRNPRTVSHKARRTAPTPRKATTQATPPRGASPTFAERLAARTGGAAFLRDLRALRLRANDVGIRGQGPESHPAEMFLDLFVMVAVHVLSALLTIVDRWGTSDVAPAIDVVHRSLGSLVPAVLDASRARLQAGLPAVPAASTSLRGACVNVGAALHTARKELDEIVATAEDACRPEEQQQLGGHLEALRGEAIRVLQAIRTAEREVETIQALTVGAGS